MPVDPVVLLAFGAAAVTLLLLGVAAEMTMTRRARQRRIRTATEGRGARAIAAGSSVDGTENAVWRNQALGVMRGVAGRANLIKDQQAKETKRLLVSAGYRGKDAVMVYSFCKLVAPFAFLGGAGAYVYGLDPMGKGPMLDVLVVLAAALFGSKLPDLIVKNARDKRLESVRKALPDALDMLVICAEAGLATDAAIKRVVSEMGRRASVLGDELSLTAMELGFMPERRQALENLAERVPLPAIIAFVNTLVQAERYGTPLARAFKVLSNEQRNERMMKAEEKAGRLPATMTVPMMMFILPALFVVLIGPAILDIADNFVNR